MRGQKPGNDNPNVGPMRRLPLPCRTAQTPLYVARASSALRL